MRHLVKYVLVAVVVFAGYRAASRVGSPMPAPNQDGEPRRQALAHDSSDSNNRTDTAAETHPVPLAALIDTNRAVDTSDKSDWRTIAQMPTVRRGAALDTSEARRGADPLRDSPSTTEALARFSDSASHQARAESSSTASDWPSKADSLGGGKPARPGNRGQNAARRRRSIKPAATKKRAKRLSQNESGRVHPAGDGTVTRPAPSHSGTGFEPESAPDRRIQPRTDETAYDWLYSDEAYGAWDDGPTEQGDPARNDGTDEMAGRSETSGTWRQSVDWAGAGDSGRGRRESEDFGQADSSMAIDVDQPEREAAGKDSPATVRHRIVDGDTLPKLANRYLGSRTRYLEIFRANQEVLSDPRLLPIGVEIAIPGATEEPGGENSKDSMPSGGDADREDGDHGWKDGWDQPQGPASNPRDDDAPLVPVPRYALPPTETDSAPPYRVGRPGPSSFRY